MTRSLRLTAAAAAVTLAACGGDKATGSTPLPAAVVAVSANPVGSLVVASAVPTPPTFEVRSTSGEAIGGVPVTVTVTAGGGTLSGAPTASQAGPTSIGTWTLGQVSGPQTVSVSVQGVAPLVFTVNALPGAPVALMIVEGNNQAASPSTVVPGPMRVRVRDGFGNGVPDVTVNWTIDAGGGQLAAATSVSNTLGIATAPEWTLGASGEQAILATVGASSARFVALETAFSVDVRFVGTTPSTVVAQAFENAATRIRSVITGDLTDVPLSGFAVSTACVSPQQTLTETIDDVLIFALVEAIDGPGGTLGSAGPCNIRNSNALTVIGRMRFDSADLETLAADGRLETVILHEMLHVIGVGTLWETLGLREGTGTSASRFTGALAREACVTLNGGATPCSSAVPAENCLDLPIGQDCGAGTQDSHWKESVFRTELMTGYLSSGLNPFSATTVQSLADMGYQVNLNLADAYQVPPPSLQSWLVDATRPPLRMPAPFRPLSAIDESGRAVPLPQ